MKFYEPQEYQALARTIYLKLNGVLESILPAAKTEHIGSSAIAGAISKGDLDIFVGVSKENFKSSIKLVESIGFNIKEQTLRTDSLCMLESSNYEIDVAIQLVELGSEYENFLKFRDRLNADANLLQQYNRLKKESEELDEVTYRERKSKFILEVLRSV